MRKILLLLVLLCTPAVAQDWARARLEKSPRHLEWVKVKAGSRSVECFVAYPEVKGKAAKTFEPKIYSGAGHGFMRAGAAPDATEGNAQACKDAWKRMLDLLKSK